MFHTDEQMQKLGRNTDEEVNKVLLRRLFTIQKSSHKSGIASAFLKGGLVSHNLGSILPQRAKGNEDYIIEQDKILSALRRSISNKKY